VIAKGYTLHLQEGGSFPPLTPQATAFQTKEESTLLSSSWLYKINFILNFILGSPG